jgi:transposase-like protein
LRVSQDEKCPGQSTKQGLKDLHGRFTGYLFWAELREDAMKAAGRLQAKWDGTYPHIVEQVLANLDNFLAFMDDPKERWKNHKTSSRIERFNRESRARLNPSGTIHSDLELSTIV